MDEARKALDELIQQKGYNYSSVSRLLGRNAAFETETAGFTLVNASANWRPFGRNRNISLIASANNLFDVTARRAASFTKDYVPLSGRDFRLTARFSF